MQIHHLADSAPPDGSSLAITAIFVGIASTLTGAAALVNAVSKLVQAVRGSPRRTHAGSHRTQDAHEGQEGADDNDEQ